MIHRIQFAEYHMDARFLLMEHVLIFCLQLSLAHALLVLSGHKLVQLPSGDFKWVCVFHVFYFILTSVFQRSCDQRNMCQRFATFRALLRAIYRQCSVANVLAGNRSS